MDTKRPMTLEDFVGLASVSSLTVSTVNDYAACTTSVVENGSKKSFIYAVALDATTPPRRLAQGSNPVWSTDGSTLFYLSTTPDCGTQVFAMPFTDGGVGASYQVTRFSVPVEEFSNTGYGDDEDTRVQLLAFRAEVVLDWEEGSNSMETTERLRASGAVGDDARVVDVEDLPARHWNAWNNGLRRHVFVVGVGRERSRMDVRGVYAAAKQESSSGGGGGGGGGGEESGGGGSLGVGAQEEEAHWGDWVCGEWVDLLAKHDTDCPPRPFGSLGSATSFGPGAETVALCYKRPGRKVCAAWDTGIAVHTYSVPVVELVASATAAAETHTKTTLSPPSLSPSTPQPPPPPPLSLGYTLPKHHCLTPTTPTIHTSPCFSPDGSWLAWLAMETPGYESDTLRLHIAPWGPAGAAVTKAATRSSPSPPPADIATFQVTGDLDVSFSSLRWVSAGVLAASTTIQAVDRVAFFSIRDATVIAEDEEDGGGGGDTPDAVEGELMKKVSSTWTVLGADDDADIGGKKPAVKIGLLQTKHSVHSICPCRDRFTSDGTKLLHRIAFINSSLRHPSAVCMASVVADEVQRVSDEVKGAAEDIPEVRLRERVRLTSFNDAKLVGFALQRPIQLYTHRDKESGEARVLRSDEVVEDAVHAWLVPPPSIPDPTTASEAEKVPLLLALHGGPQGCWGDDWHGRWNLQLMAAHGFAVLAPNITGSTSFGKRFCDAIQGDWGGQPAREALDALEAVGKEFPWVDTSRTVVMGGSYGGYLTNWLAATAPPDTFRAAVSHAGPYHLHGWGGSTEELWFAEREFGGPAFSSKELYEKFSPSNQVATWTTPTLFTHGSEDFRVPVEESLAAFSALRRRGIPSRLLVFRGEDHWITNPTNFVRWWRAVFEWAEKNCGEEKKGDEK